jgi:GNAT superfamily N-acetyltransferase
MLREAHRDDIPAMHRIRLSVRENRLRNSVVSEADYAPFIEEHGRGWVIEDNGELVGFAIGNVRNGSVWALFVDPNHERNGHGRQLHQAMVSWLWSQGLERLWLTTDPDTRARRFYEAAGWRQTGTEAGGELRFELRRPQPGTAVDVSSAASRLQGRG